MIGDFILQLAATSLVCLFVWLSYRKNWFARARLSPRAGWTTVLIASGSYFIVFSAMSWLRYRSMTPAVMDLGVFENMLWRVSHGDFTRLLESYTHTMPLMAVPALIYRVFPDPLTMFVFQTGIIALSGILAFRLARVHLEPWPSAAVALVFLLHPGTGWMNIFDFHSECLFAPLFLGAAWALETRRRWLFFALGLGLFLIKEPLMLSGAALGLYALWTRNARLQGSLIAILGVAFFVVSVSWLIPALMDKTYPYYRAYALPSPATIPGRLVYFINLFAPAGFVPLGSPLELLAALPHLVFSLLSSTATNYSIRYHYSASIIPPIIYALVFVLKKARRPRSLAASIIISAVAYNLFVSPSPFSYEFWAKPKSLNNFRHYIPERRDAEVMAFLARTVPADPGLRVTVSDQRGVYASVIGQRWRLDIFPDGVGTSDLVVLDTSGEPLVWSSYRPIKDTAGFRAGLERVRASYDVLGECHGVVVFGKRR